MPVIAPTKVWIAGVPIEFIDGAPIEITISRGITPSLFAVVLRSDGTADKKLAAKNNPVSIKIECADHTSVGKDEIELKNWYIINRREREKGLVVYTIADVRWAHDYNKLTAQYNIVSYGGFYRPASIPSGAAWKSLFAAEDALKKLGYEVEVTDDARFGIGSVQLPDNLGNDPQGGGWVAATQAEAIEPMLESAAGDVVPTKDGKLALVEHVAEKSKDVEKYAMAMGDIKKASVIWQEPAEIIVPFRKRIERLLTYVEGGKTSSTGWDFHVENVMPDWRPGATGILDHKPIADWMAGTDLFGFKYLGGNINEFRKRYMKRQTFDIRGNFTAQVLDAMFVAQGLVRACYWLHFRIRPTTAGAALDDVRGNYADVRIERLQRDGTGRTGGVFMDYTRKLRFGKPNPYVKVPNPLEAEFSEGVRLNYGAPAPASARWVDRENLVFEIVFDTPQDRQVVGYMPGRLSEEISYGGTKNFQAAIRGTAKFVTDDTAQLQANFTAAVYWHGLWIKDGKGDEARLYEEKFTGFQGGRGRPTLTARVVSDLTANYQYDDAALGKFPGKLLNGRELNERAKQIVAEIKASLVQKRAGVSTHVGINVLTRGKIWVAGDIHEIKIIINGRKKGSVETRVTVLPGRRPEKQGVFTGRRGEAAVESSRIL